MHGTGCQVYQRSQILTADPKRLVLLCYEEAIKSLIQASAKYQSKNYEAKGRAVQQALDLLNYLRETLNFEKGGDVARHLDRLYGFMIGYVLKCDQSKNGQGFTEVAKMLEQLKTAWEEAFYRKAERPSPFPKEGTSPFYTLSEGVRIE